VEEAGDDTDTRAFGSDNGVLLAAFLDCGSIELSEAGLAAEF
jgi:hypothetical protein